MFILDFHENESMVANHWDIGDKQPPWNYPPPISKLSPLKHSIKSKLYLKHPRTSRKLSRNSPQTHISQTLDNPNSTTKSSSLPSWNNPKLKSQKCYKTPRPKDKNGEAIRFCSRGTGSQAPGAATLGEGPRRCHGDAVEDPRSVARRTSRSHVGCFLGVSLWYSKTFQDASFGLVLSKKAFSLGGAGKFVSCCFWCVFVVLLSRFNIQGNFESQSVGWCSVVFCWIYRGFEAVWVVCLSKKIHICRLVCWFHNFSFWVGWMILVRMFCVCSDFQVEFPHFQESMSCGSNTYVTEDFHTCFGKLVKIHHSFWKGRLCFTAQGSARFVTESIFLKVQSGKERRWDFPLWIVASDPNIVLLKTLVVVDEGTLEPSPVIDFLAYTYTMLESFDCVYLIHLCT